MSQKNIILLIVLAALIGAAFIYEGPYHKWKTESDKPVNFLSVVSPDQISRIEITTDGKIAALEKSGDKWKISGTKAFYVAEATASYLNDKLKQAIDSDLDVASQVKEKQSSFATDETAGINVKLYQGDSQVANFYVGKMGSDYNSTYISPANSNMTYLVGANLYNAFNPGDWYDKSIIAISEEKISKIRFQYPNREFAIEKKGENWEGAAPRKFTVKSEKVTELLSLFAGFMADSIPEQKFEGTGLDKNLIIVQVTGEGVNETVMVGTANKEGKYFAKKANSDNIYLITKEQKELLDKEIKELQ